MNQWLLEVNKLSQVRSQLRYARDRADFRKVVCDNDWAQISRVEMVNVKM